MKRNISKSAKQIRKIIDEAMDSGTISKDNYDKVIHIASEDYIIDAHEKILLSNLNDLIFSKDIKIID